MPTVEMNSLPGSARGVYRLPAPGPHGAPRRGAPGAIALLLGALVLLAGSARPQDGADEEFLRPPRPAPSADEVRRGRRALAHVSVRDTAARYRRAEPLTFGVPLRSGQVADASTLRLWDAESLRPLPSQVRALSRWPDGSARWVLVDTVVELQARETRPLALGFADDVPAVDDPWRVQRREDGGLLLDDGATVWTLFEPGEDGGRVLGIDARLVDVFGHEYRAEVDPGSLTWVERGPLRAVARFRGAHRSVDGEGLGLPFHTFTVHVHVRAGLGQARVDWTVENTALAQPTGPLAFDSYVLSLHPEGEVTGVELGVRSLEHDGGFALEQEGPAGTRMTLEGEPVYGARSEDLWAGLLTDGDGWFARMVDSAENHPSRLAHDAGGPLRLEVLPAGMGETFWLDDATRKTFRIDVVREAGGATGRARMTEAIRPAHVALVPLEVLATEAWGDAGRFYVPRPLDLKKPSAPPRDPPTGWAHWGEALGTNTHQSGSPRNQLSVFLEAMQSGRADLHRWNVARARHAMDLRPYHLEGFDADRMPWANLYEGTPHSNNSTEHSLGRKGMHNRHTEWKEEIPRGGHGYNGFDPEHMSLDDVYEYYLLTGDWLALDALRSAGEAVLTWKEIVEHSIHSSRTFGWTLRALVQVHRATGDPRYLDAARAYVAAADEQRGTGDVKYLRRMKPDRRHLADEHYDAPFMVAVALHGLAAYWHETRDPIVPPMVADLVSFEMSAYREGGFMPDMPTDRVMTDGAPSSPLGVSEWIPGAVAAAAFVTGDHDPVDRLLPYYGLLRHHSSDPIAFGASGWHWWQPYLASLQQRHGDAAIVDPEGFLARRERRR